MLRELSIRNKLALVLWGAALLVYAVAGLGLALFQSLTLERRARQVMEPYAHMVSVGTDAAVAFEDPDRAQEILNTLRSNPQILQAHLVLQDGRILASFSRIPSPFPSPILSRPAGIYLAGDSADLLQNLPQGARLHLTMSLSRLRQQTHQIFWMFGAGVLALLAVTLGQMAVLQRTIVGPLRNLTEATELCRVGTSYCRVPASGSDEVGRLGQSFNSMIETVQQRERDLQSVTIFQRTLLDHAAYSIISTTTDGVVRSFNPAAERLLGYSAAEVVGMETPLLWHDRDEVARRARQLTQELGETIEPGFEAFVARTRRNALPDENEWTFIRKDGSRVPGLLSVTALREECGEATGFMGLARDLTERKRAEAELRESEQRYRQLNETLEQRIAQAVGELQQKNRMLVIQSRQAVMGEMISNIAHQWRQPLNTLGLLAQELQMTSRMGDLTQAFLDANVKRTMEIIKHMSKTIDDFRYFFTQTRQKEEFRAREVLEKTLSLLEASLAEQRIRIQIEATGDPVMTGYANEFSQVLLNLLSNARDAFTARKVADPLVSFRVFSEGGKTVVTVADNAGGIPEEIIDKVFEPYFTTKGPEQGTGIGLFMCKTIVEKNMNGSITVRNAGAGAEFRIEV